MRCDASSDTNASKNALKDLRSLVASVSISLAYAELKATHRRMKRTSASVFSASARPSQLMALCTLSPRDSGKAARKARCFALRDAKLPGASDFLVVMVIDLPWTAAGATRHSELNLVSPAPGGIDFLSL